ncbi:MAG: hypothetical protein EA384_08160 [Spirochaetaceae bacterium]|nr:MAG: hypothetical protein EA384_08160 [Spirochaetaceae bacterium]
MKQGKRFQPVGLVAALAAVIAAAGLPVMLPGCDVNGALREDFSYRLTVTIAAAEGVILDSPAPLVRILDPPVDLPETDGVYVLEEDPDYAEPPRVIEIRTGSSAALVDDQFFSVTVTYRELGTLPVAKRTLFRARREAGDGAVAEIWTQVVVPQ